MRRFLLAGCAAATLGALSACSSADSTAPAVRPAAPASALHDFNGDWHDGLPVPGSGGNASNGANAHTQPIACNVPARDSVSKVIGASGGILDVGPTRLIIPPGALTKDTLVTGVVPAGNTVTVQFSPQGLHFKKPAGLIIDATNCSNVPNVLWINEVGGENELIVAIYSNWWHLIAAPLDHFSLYTLAM